jgi:transposase
VSQTEKLGLTPLQAVAAYKQLNEVERAFRDLKHLVELRPVYHQKEERVRARMCSWPRWRSC